MGSAGGIGAAAGWAFLRIVTYHVRPRGPAYGVALGRAIGRIAWAIPSRRKRLSLRNAAVALPHLTPRERRRAVREAVLNSFPYWPEPATYVFRGPRNLLRTIRVEGREHLDAALARGRGVLAPGIHLGIFPFMAAWMTQAGYDFQFLSRFPHNKLIADLMGHYRARLGIRLIRDLPRRQCLVDCRAALARGGIIGFQLDQKAMGSYPGVDIPFFGREFHAFGGMVSLALKAGAPLVPMYIYRERPGASAPDVGPARAAGGIHHRLVIEPEIEVDAGLSRKEATRRAIELLVGRFEVWVRERPEHWWWPRRIWVGV